MPARVAGDASGETNRRVMSADKEVSMTPAIVAHVQVGVMIRVASRMSVENTPKEPISPAMVAGLLATVPSEKAAIARKIERYQQRCDD